MEHTHEKHHHEGCTLGHDHEHAEHMEHTHENHHHEGCTLGHDHEHADHMENVGEHVEQKVYILENLGCANCAAKMEQKINELPEVEGATITFATKQLRVASDHQEELLPELQRICASIESEVVVRKMEEKTKEKTEDRRAYWELGVGILLFVGGILLESVLPFHWTLFLIAYVVLGGDILIKAGKNMMRGQVFDENFLMSLATLAAIAISDYKEAVGVMLFFRVGELFEKIAVEKSRKQIMEAVDMRPETVSLVVEEEVSVIPAKDAKVGDVLVVRPGDRIPLDGVVVLGESRIDTAPVTGEPVPVKVSEGSAVISGCVNKSGVLQIRVEKALQDSMVTRILNSVEHAAASKPQVEHFITRFARVYTPFVVGLALLTAVIPSLVTGNWDFWIYTAITFLVISCPCALVLSVPLAFFSGIGAGSKQGILFKGGLALETLHKVRAIVMDKTGTITKGTFEVQACVPTGDVSEEKLLALAASVEKESNHPIAESILTAASEKTLELQTPWQVEEISGRGIRAKVKEGEVLCGNRLFLKEEGILFDEPENLGYGTEVLLALNHEFVGYILIADSVKEDAKDAILAMKRAGLKTVMLTGDAMQSAKTVGADVGVEEIYAHLLPEEKLEKLKQTRETHGAVMFVGDGMNDAPVLAGADVGAAMGSGADAAIEAADVVFMTSAMGAISEAIQIARTTNRIARQNVVFALAVKVLVMVLGICGMANMWMAVFADTGVAMLCVLNSIRILYRRKG